MDHPVWRLRKGTSGLDQACVAQRVSGRRGGVCILGRLECNAKATGVIAICIHDPILTCQLAQLYINENAHGNGDVERMKHAVWVDLTSALLWLIATVAASAYWLKHRNTRTRFTGRAKV